MTKTTARINTPHITKLAARLLKAGAPTPAPGQVILTDHPQLGAHLLYSVLTNVRAFCWECECEHMHSQQDIAALPDGSARIFLSRNSQLKEAVAGL